jgi:hypothetical protein
VGKWFASTFSNPLTDFEIAASVVTCASGYVPACISVGLLFAAMNAGIAIANGVGFEQTAELTAIGLGVGIATGGAAGGGLTGLVVGSASAAVTTGIANVAAGRSFLGYDMLGAAFLSAAQGAATMALGQVIASSQASAARVYAANPQGASGTDDSGEEVAEFAAHNRAVGMAAGGAANEAQWTEGYGSQQPAAVVADLNNGAEGSGGSRNDEGPRYEASSNPKPYIPTPPGTLINEDPILAIVLWLSGEGEVDFVEGMAGEGEAVGGAGRVFYGTPEGTLLEGPTAYVPTAAENGDGLVLLPEGQSLGNNSDIVRWGEPNAQSPDGYFRYYNSSGQPLNPATGLPGPNSVTHISPTYQGPLNGYPGR